ncbi:DUF937 domain-containing protein [Mycolicibacterium sp.]|jgi:hypothetical protein|uniref:DUF937 domain-containing protein n=1 Tax=Mycolicibacterium sp. TaxID=2320850 RepID=UPI001A311407|nr:DUF937 domain-containing protein [Mycolicibacterium sp.]MBJ7400519.1 DUF937 domain-containing protein [Mycolicibacterium sp.]
MAGLEDLYNQIPVADIANKLGADPSEVNQAIQTLVPTLLGSLHENVQADDIDSTHLESAVVAEGQSDLLTGGINVDQIDQGQGNQLIASLFGGNDTNQVASALSGAGAGGGDLIKRLLPMLAPIVLAYVGKQFAAKNAGAQAQAAPGGGIGDVLGGLLGGGGGGAANNPLGNILGSVLGGNQGGAIGNILGGLLRGGK